MTLDLITKLLPAIAGVMYAVVGLAYLLKSEYAWSMVWISYATANFGLTVAGNQ